MNRIYWGVFFVLLSATGFGVMPIFTMYAYSGGADVTGLLFLRFLCTAVLLFLFLLVRGVKLGVSRGQLLALFVLGGILYTLQSMSYFSAVKYIPASLAALLLYTFPIFVSILALLIDKEKMPGRNIGAIILSVLGLTLVLGTSFGKVNMLGIILALAAAIFYSCYIFISHKVLKETSPIVTSAYIALFATCSLFIVGASTDALHFQYESHVWGALVGIVLFSTILPMITLFIGMKRIGSTKASIISMIEPLVTIGFSVVLFAERLTWLQICGAIAVLGGAVLVVAARGKHE